jgi:hypothetical protein
MLLFRATYPVRGLVAQESWTSAYCWRAIGLKGESMVGTSIDYVSVRGTLSRNIDQERNARA